MYSVGLPFGNQLPQFALDWKWPQERGDALPKVFLLSQRGEPLMGFRTGSKRRLRTVVALLAVIIGGSVAPTVHAASSTPEEVLAEARSFAEATRSSGPVFLDPSTAVTTSTPTGEFISARAHDYLGWFIVFARLGERPLVAYAQADGDRFAGAVTRLSPIDGTAGEALPFDIPLATATADDRSAAMAPGDDVIRQEEENCAGSFDLVAGLADCRYFADCFPGIPGPFGTMSYFGAPWLCQGSPGKGLTWWSGNTVEMQKATTYNSLSQHPWFTEIADWDYKSQGCAAPETIRAWNEDVSGTTRDLDEAKCYDFRATGPQPRVVIYNLKVIWSDGVVQTARFVSEGTFLSGLWYHDHSLMTPEHYLQQMDMTESLGPNQFVGSYRFGRAFRDWHYTRCVHNGGACN